MRNRLRHMNSVKHWSKSNFIPAFVLAFLTLFSFGVQHRPNCLFRQLRGSGFFRGDDYAGGHLCGSGK